MTDTPKFDAKAFREFEIDVFSKAAEGYNKGAIKVTSQVNEPMLNAVQAGEGTRLLDLACGPGALSAAAAKRGAVVTGLDMAEPMLAIARSRCPEGEFHNGDAENLPFEDEAYDAVVSSFGILHIADADKAISEVHRVLKPGGSFAFTCWFPPEKNPFMGLILGSVEAHGTLEVNLPPGPPLYRFGDPIECQNVLKAAGFAPEPVTEVPVVWGFSSLESVVEEIKANGGRLVAILNQQTDEQRRNIENAITEGARAYEKNGAIRIPAPALLAVGRKP